MSATMLLVDDAANVTELFASLVAHRLGWTVEVANRPDDVTPSLVSERRFDLAVVDLSFAHEERNGLDVLVTVHRHAPATRLVILTQGDDYVAQMLRDAWEAFPIAGAISKTTPTDGQLAMMAAVVRDGMAPPDPVLQPWLPRERSSWRRADQFGQLVPHVGHAKLWQALIDADGGLSYRELGDATGLAINTLKNYRAQLLHPLALHDLREPSMQDMQQFAKRCRPLLAPFLDAKLSPGASA